MKHAVIATLLVVVVTSANARLVSEIDKDIVKLRNEATKLQKNPIVVWGSKQEKLSPEQKCATSRYNINLAQAKERKNYKSRTVITLNPEYVCSIHKKVYVDGRPTCSPECKSIERIGTSNFCNLGAEYDLSFRSWNLLKEKMPDGEIQEERLKEIEKEISILQDEKRAVEKAPSKNKDLGRKPDTGTSQTNTKDANDAKRELVNFFGKSLDDYIEEVKKLGGSRIPCVSRKDTDYKACLKLPYRHLENFNIVELLVNSQNKICGCRFHAMSVKGADKNRVAGIVREYFNREGNRIAGLDDDPSASGKIYKAIGFQYQWLFYDIVRTDLQRE